MCSQTLVTIISHNTNYICIYSICIGISTVLKAFFHIFDLFYDILAFRIFLSLCFSAYFGVLLQELLGGIHPPDWRNLEWFLLISALCHLLPVSFHLPFYHTHSH